MTQQRFLCALALSLLAAGRLSAACTTPSYQSLTPVALGHDAVAFAVGFANADAHLDAATTSAVTDDIRVIPGIGDGTFAAHVSYPVADPGRLKFQDVNKDGWADLIVNHENAKIGVLLNNGSGAFGSIASVNAGLHLVTSMNFGDFNNDSNIDVLVTDLGADTGKPDIHILWGNGTGGFPTRTEWQLGGNAADAVPGDFNGDGMTDIAVVFGAYQGSQPGTLAIYLNTSNGFVTTAANFSYTVGGTNATYDIAVANFNSNGGLDLVVSFYNGFRTFLANSNGSFSLGAGFTMSPSDFVAVDAGDLNEDGKPDLTFASLNASDVVTMVGLGNGNYATPPQRFAIAASHMNDVAIGDANGDGRPDVLLLETSSDEIRILANTCPERYAVVTISSSANPSIYPNDVTITATVAARGGTLVPGGVVSLYDEGTFIGNATLTQNATNATATFTLTKPNVGIHTLRATYSGDVDFGSSEQSHYAQTVERPPFGAPLDLRATRYQSTTAIHMNWVGTTGASGYEVFRRNGATWGEAVLQYGEEHADLMVPNSMPQVYAVRSIREGGQPSALSTPDVANTFNYSSPLPIGAVVRATDMTELRTLINGLRTNVGLSPFSFTDATLTSGMVIKAMHVIELRTALAQAFAAVGMPQPTYSRPVITPGVTAVAAADLLEIRNALR